MFKELKDKTENTENKRFSSSIFSIRAQHLQGVGIGTVNTPDLPSGPGEPSRTWARVWVEEAVAVSLGGG